MVNTKRKLHSERPLPYPSSIVWTKCGRQVERNQIAGFEAGVTCMVCQKASQLDREHEALSKDRSKG